jgi:hypothetical protein
MGIIFTLDSELKAIIQDALDDLITELGKPVRLVYPPQLIACDCTRDNVGSKPGNIWTTGGRIPVGSVGCSFCNGTGKKAESETRENFKMLIAWEPKDFFVPAPNLEIRYPFSIIQTKFYLKDAPEIMRVDHIVLQPPIESIVRQKYKLASQAGDPSNIIQGRYAVATWSQI